MYQTYPQLSEPIRNNYSQQLDDIFKQNNFIAISQIGGAQFENTEKKPENEIVGISHLGGGQFKTAGELLLNHFSFRHLTYILRIEKPIKRYFYEQQTIKCQWNAKQLGRQIETLYYERVGLSKDKKEMLQADLQQIFQDLVKQTVNDPYVFEFSGFREHHKYSENDLETALLDKIEDFMLELGHGFCFEARQKRITIDGEHDRIDLVFYHRILKCHILIDLKIRKFRKEYIGQMIYYLNYYTENMMTKHDNPPIGIILCTDKSETRVHYATSGLDQQIFISKYNQKGGIMNKRINPLLKRSGSCLRGWERTGSGS